MSLLGMYVDRAADCRREADASPLVNVRERFLRAALAWDEMADHQRASDRFKANERIRLAERALLQETARL